MHHSQIEGIKLRLDDNTFYAPDLAAMLTDGALVMHEVKGLWQDDAGAKIEIVADLHSLRFVAVRGKSRKEGGWGEEEF